MSSVTGNWRRRTICVQQCFSAGIDFVCVNVNHQMSCVNISAHRHIQICVCFSPCGSFQSANVHMWSCQRRWEWWPFSTLPPGSKSSPGWDPPCRGWSRSCDCLKDTPIKLKLKRTGKIKIWMISPELITCLFYICLRNSTSLCLPKYPNPKNHVPGTLLLIPR